MSQRAESRRGVVLVVDDEPENLEAFRFNFEDSFEIHAVTSGDEALRVLERTAVEVIVADQRMPGMSGLDLLEEVQTRRPLITRILLTAHTNEELLVESINRQVVQRFVSKPWNYDHLLSTIDSAVERHRLSKRNRELERRLDGASRLSLLGELASALVHDLTQPLQVVATGLFTAREIVTGGLASVARDLDDLDGALADADAAVMHLRRLASTVRGQMQQRPAKMSEHYLADVVDEVAMLLRHHVLSRKIHLVRRVRPEAGQIMADRVQLAQLIANLATNACDALENQRERRLTLAVETGPEDSQVLVISDTGDGIPPEIRSTMFRAFVTTKPEGKGMGLGLAIVRRIADAHHAKIDVDSFPGEGTTFRITFPSPNLFRASTLPMDFEGDADSDATDGAVTTQQPEPDRPSQR